MVGCSLTEAFPDTTEQSGKVARKKAKSSKGPALSFLQQDSDPDRTAERPPPPPEKMSTEGFAEFSSMNGQKVDDVIGSNSKPRALPKATTASEVADPTRMSNGDPVPSYFGKSGDSEDGFADFNKALSDNRGYKIDGSDFASSFGAKGLDKAAGGNLLGKPSLNDNWKPLSPNGVHSSFFNTYPAVASNASRGHDNSFSKEEKETLLKKLDTLFARLEDLETKRNEYAHAEVTLFILSGLFLMFGLESVRKLR